MFFEFLVFCRYCWQDLVEFLPISKKEFKNSLIRFFFGRSKMSRVLSARARARARARPSCSTGASGPFDDRRLRSTTFRARATLVLLLYRTFFGALIVLLRLEANLSGSTLTCRFTFICRFWVLLKVCRLIPSRTTGWRHDDRSIRARTLFFKVVFCAFFV